MIGVKYKGYAVIDAGIYQPVGYSNMPGADYSLRKSFHIRLIYLGGFKHPRWYNVSQSELPFLFIIVCAICLTFKFPAFLCVFIN